MQLIEEDSEGLYRYCRQIRGSCVHPKSQQQDPKNQRHLVFLHPKILPDAITELANLPNGWDPAQTIKWKESQCIACGEISRVAWYESCWHERSQLHVHTNMDEVHYHVREAWYWDEFVGWLNLVIAGDHRWCSWLEGPCASIGNCCWWQLYPCHHLCNQFCHHHMVTQVIKRGYDPWGLE